MGMSSPSIHVHDTPAEAAAAVAAECAALIRLRAAEGRSTVLGLATGSTPLPFYAELIRLHRDDGLSFAGVTTFNLDEYLGLEPGHPESYAAFMAKHLFDHVDLGSDRTHLPPGQEEEGDLERVCGEYERSIVEAGGIDFQILGIGRTGHIGFNEPGSPRDSRTRRIDLDPVTRQDAAPAFGGLEHVPTHAITMGCGTILAARRVVLMAWGEKKAEIVREALEEDVTDRVSASFLQEHGNAAFFLDAGAASALTPGAA